MKRNFEYREDENQRLEELIECNDPARINWVSHPNIWGKVQLKEGVKCSITRTLDEDGNFVERYVFRNVLENEIFVNLEDISIAISLPDKYESARVCMQKCCHVHLWCGGDVSWICGMRMAGSNGKQHHIGAVLRKGSLGGYSVERNVEARSNDRGIFLLHPNVGALKQEACYEIEIVWFWFEKMEEFYEKLKQEQKYMKIDSENFVRFCGQDMELQIETVPNEGEKEEICIQKNGTRIYDYKMLSDGRIAVSGQTTNCGEEVWDITIGNLHTIAKMLVLPKAEDLLEKRCNFIVTKQQFKQKDSKLDGALLIYDNETESVYYSKEYDHNAGRERVGMGALLALYLQHKKDTQIARALEKYTEFVLRELYEEEIGIVYNDATRDNEWNRLYNYPWVAIFFMERFHLYHRREDAARAYKALASYYEQGGASFYAIGIPMIEMIEMLENEGLSEMHAKLKKYFVEHVDAILENGMDYPRSEVNYEQSIVAPAVSYLYQGYMLTGNEKYLEEAEKQIKILELFNGMQPDYHLKEVAIRHWDGYWFGKRKLYGDTFPHYWSALSGIVFYYRAKLFRDEHYRKKAENSMKGVLSLFYEDGRASCAYLYPCKVNGVAGCYFDPWANDQDWGLYYYIKYFCQETSYEKSTIN